MKILLDAKSLEGVMNTDDDNWILPKGHHKSAFNIRLRGNAGNMRPETILGTTLISNDDLPDTGTNVTVGGLYDDQKQRIFYFNYNTLGEHGIYILDLATRTIQPLILIGAGTDGDILGFTLTRTIYNINIIYGDEDQGDAIYWIDSFKRPSYVNIDKQLNGDYGVLTRTDINVIKYPFDNCPYAIYADDDSVTVNNLRRTFFQFKTRPVYIDGTKGVWSSRSAVPLPVNYTDSEIDADSTKNCRVDLIIQTGEKNVKKIEVAAAQSLGTQFGDFFLINVLNKSELGLPDDDITKISFFNNQSYTYIDVTESVQEFDWLPDEAEAQELLNGNALIYGNSTEGYPLAILDAAATADNDPIENVDYYNVLFVVAQLGESGFETGNIHAIVLGTPKTGNIFNIETTNELITFTVGGTETTAAVIAGLSAAAVVAGFTVVSSDSENLVITKTGESLLRFSSDTTGNDDICYIYDWSSRYGFGIVYFTAAGKTNGAVYTDGITVQTPTYFENALDDREYTYITLSISSRPPIWASYYQILRTSNLSKSKWLYWVTPITFKDETYAYLSIENLNQYIRDNPTASFLQYDSTPNDRIKIIKLYPTGGITTPIIYPSAVLGATNKDFPIVSSVVDPVINGAVKQGQFVKINLPDTGSTFDFGTQDVLGVPVNYDNYFIQLYTPAKSVEGGLNLYYEFGERYGIGNELTSNAFHQGQLQNQSQDLVTPATFKLVKGDAFLRHRDIYAANELKYTLVEGDVGYYDFVAADLESTFDAAGYVAQSQAAGHVNPNSNQLENSSNWMINITDGNAYDFRIKGSITVKAVNNASSQGIYSILVVNPAGVVIHTDLFVISPMVAGKQYTFDVDKTFNVPAGYTKVFLMGYSVLFFDAVIHTVSGSLTITNTDKTFSEYVIDQNFSDFFQSQINSNGRAWVYDSNAKTRVLSNIHRWGLNYQPNTNINNSNRFFANNFIESDLSKGGILRYVTRGQQLMMYFQRGVGKTGIYAKYIQSNDGTDQLVTTNDIITKNNIQYFYGEHGVGLHPENVVVSSLADYFVDPVTGDQIRVTENGIQSINRIYKGDYYIRSLLTPYNKVWSRTDGSYAKILGAFDFFENQYICVLQDGINGGDMIGAYTFSFDEKRNAYCCFYDFFPEWILSAQDFIVTFKDGNIYIHDNASAMNTFYGSNYASRLKLVFNTEVMLHKKQLSVAYQSNNTWVSPTNGDIRTSYYNQQTGFQQISQLKAVDYTAEEGKIVAAFLRDANSLSDPQLALMEGDYLEGNWLEIEFQYFGSESVWIYAPLIRYNLSNPNP